MNSKFLSLMALSGLAIASQSAFAADGTITFNGEVTSQTCSINNVAADGARDITVTMPKASQSSLAVLNSTTGETNFSIALTSCTPASGTVRTRFEPGTTVHQASGELITSGAGSSTSLRIQLLNSDRSVIAVGAPDASQNSTAQTIPAGGAVTLNYIARYKRASATPALGTGVVSSSVTYSLVYN